MGALIKDVNTESWLSDPLFPFRCHRGLWPWAAHVTSAAAALKSESYQRESHLIRLRRAHNNMRKAGESQRKRLCIGHLQTRARPWPKCMFVMLLSNNVPVCNVPPLCALIVLSHDWSAAGAIPQVSDIWSPGLIGPRRAWHSTSIMPQADPIKAARRKVSDPFVAQN